MKTHWNYLWYVLRHKWYVFVAGRALGLPVSQLLIHDLSKFSRTEWGPYARRFFGGRGGVMDKAADPEEFRRAWTHHWQHNPHHPEYWAPFKTLIDVETEAYTNRGPMPDLYIREMVADWYGAGMAQGKPDCWAWYRQNRDRYPITEEAHAAVERYLLALTDAGLIPWEFAGPDPNPSEFRS